METFGNVKQTIKKAKLLFGVGLTRKKKKYYFCRKIEIDSPKILTT
jgi:hypothetical protein